MFIPIALFFFVLAVYLRTHCASFNINDSGETILVCKLLTISHSPGYPLHTLWGNVNCLLPLGKPMLRVTLASVTTAALSVVLVYATMKAILRDLFRAASAPPDRSQMSTGERAEGPWKLEIPALFAALVFAFSYQHWFQAGGAKGGIYTLNTLLSVSMLFFFFKMRESGWFLKSFLLMAFLYGLGLAHHWPNQAVMGPAYLWFLLNGQKRIPLSDLLGWASRPLFLIYLGISFLFFWMTLLFLFSKGPSQAFFLSNLLCGFLVIGAVMARVFGWARLGWAAGVFFFVWAFTQATYTPPPVLPGVPTPSPSALPAAVAAGIFVLFNFLVRIFGMVPFLRSLVMGLLSLSVYLFLPIRALQDPLVNWWDPRNFTRLIETVLRKGYENIGQMRSWETITRNVKRFWFHAEHQFGDVFTFLIFALAIWGCVWICRRGRWTTALGLGLFGFGVLAGVVFFNNPLEGYQWTLDNFFSPVFLMVALFAGAGIAGLCGWAVREWSDRRTPLMVGAVCLGFALVPLFLNLLGSQTGSESERIFKASTDQSRYVGSYDEGMNMLKTVNRRGVIVCNGDIDILPLWYLQYVEGKRTEVCSFTMQLIPYIWYRNPFFKRWPELTVPVNPTDPRPETVVQAIIDKHHVDPAEPGKPRDPSADEPWKRSFYFTNIFTAPWMREKNPSIPDGFLWRIVATKDLDYPFTSARLNSLWAGYRLRSLDAPERGYWDEYTDVMKDSYGIGHDFTGYFSMMNQMPRIALWSFQNALKYRQFQTLARIYMMVGESYLTLGDPSAALTNYQESLNREGRNPYVLSRMGEAFRAMGDMANAEAAYRAALSFNPQEKGALEGLKAMGKEAPNIVLPGQKVP